MAVDTTLGLYIPTSDVWDTSQIEDLEKESAQLKELLTRLYQNLNRMALAVNKKESALYFPQEFVDGGAWFPNATASAQQKSIDRPEWRMVIDFGALPNAAPKSIAHNITCTTSTTFTRIFATASKPTLAFAYKPIPYVDVNTPANNIQIDVDATNVIITTAVNYSAYTTCYVVLEYLQN